MFNHSGGIEEKKEMTSELYYFPNIEEEQNQTHSQLSLGLQSGFEKILPNNEYSNEGQITNGYLKNKRIDEREIAFSEGLEEGKKIGMELEKNRVDEAINLLNNAIENLEKIKNQSIEQMEDMASKLSILIAKKIIEKEANLSSTIILKTLQKAIESFEIEENIKIRVNPGDLNHIEAFHNNNILRKNVEFKTDSAISKGGCIIESDCKTIDARIESQLEIIEKAFEELRLNQDAEAPGL